MLKAYAQGANGSRGGVGGQISGKGVAKPTSVQGKIYAKYGNSFLGARNAKRPGRPARAKFIPARRGRSVV